MAFQFSLRWLLIAVAYFAVAAAAISQGWWVYADVLWTATFVAFGYAALVAITSADVTRARALGFVIFAAAFGACTHVSPDSVPVTRILALAGINDPGSVLPAPVFGPLPPQVASGTWTDSPATLQLAPASGIAVAFPTAPTSGTFSARGDPLFQVKQRAAYSLATMFAGLIGVLLAALVFAGSRAASKAAALSALLLLFLFANTASAGDIIYVDATDGANGNTRHLDGGTFTPLQGATVGNDNQWSRRPFGNQGTVFTSNDGRPPGPEDAPALVTTIGGLTPGTAYTVYAYFWTDQHNWHLRASFDPIFQAAEPSSQRATQAVEEKFSAKVLTAEDNRTMRQARVGKATADANGEIGCGSMIWLTRKAVYARGTTALAMRLLRSCRRSRCKEWWRLALR